MTSVTLKVYDRALYDEDGASRALINPNVQG